MQSHATREPIRPLAAGRKIMKKVLAAATASLLLLAGVAAAQTDSSTVRVGDRLGSQSATANQAQGTPLFLYIIGGALLAGVIYGAVNNSSGPSHSVSP
jgi:hypothetical protein